MARSIYIKIDPKVPDKITVEILSGVVGRRVKRFDTHAEALAWANERLAAVKRPTALDFIVDNTPTSRRAQ